IISALRFPMNSSWVMGWTSTTITATSLTSSPSSRTSSKEPLMPEQPDRSQRMSEGGAAAAPAATTSPVSALMAGHVLRDGELVLLLLRPSRWFILLTSLRYLAIVALLMLLSVIFDDKLHGPRRQYIEIGLLLIVGRL